MNVLNVPQEALTAYSKTRSCHDQSSLCHAPSTSLYFGRDGTVSVCCYTRAHPIGHYPQDSLRDLWFGENIESMRGHMRNQELPVGCEKCADQLVAKNYSGFLAASFDLHVPHPVVAGLNKLTQRIRHGNTTVYPTCMEFELSNKCNLECIMCSGFCSSSIRANREGKPPLPQLYDAQFCDQLREFIPHLKIAKFYGGEPFLIDLYYQIWEMFIELNPSCRIEITTNGTVLTQKVERLLRKLNFRITVSLDSVKAETYERIRKNAKLETTLANLVRFQSLSRGAKRSLSINVCPMSTNWHEIPEIVEFANSHKIRVFFTTVTYPPEAAMKFMPVRDRSSALELFRQAMRKPSGNVEKYNFKVLDDLCSQLGSWINESAGAETPVFKIV